MKIDITQISRSHLCMIFISSKTRDFLAQSYPHHVILYLDWHFHLQSRSQWIELLYQHPQHARRRRARDGEGDVIGAIQCNRRAHTELSRRRGPDLAEQYLLEQLLDVHFVDFQRAVLE